MTGMYLEHYGVLGMKWGVRKSHAEQARSQKEKLEKYKTKELGKIEKRQTKFHNKYQKYVERRAKRGKDPSIKKQNLQEARREVYKMEKKAIKNMSYKDMQKEKLAVGKEYTKTVLITAGMQSVSALAGLPVSAIYIGSPAGAKIKEREKRTQWEYQSQLLQKKR